MLWKYRLDCLYTLRRISRIQVRRDLVMDDGIEAFCVHIHPNWKGRQSMYTYSDQIRFEGEGALFKGNTHCHSTSSDGRLSAEVVAHRYREAGYSFLCFTEHERFTDRHDLNADGFIVIPAAEWSCNSDGADGREGRCHHINLIEGTQAMLDAAPLGRYFAGDVLKRPIFEGVASVRKMLDIIHGHGCIATYNHPVWSRVRPEEFGLLEGFAAMEVHNYSCELEDFTGFCETYWDNLLNDGSHICAVAADDNHNLKLPDDSCGGWIMVHAAELTQDAIVQAIIDGDFYASSGPKIMRYGTKDGVAFVDCSGANQVNFVAGGAPNAGSTVWSLHGFDDITHAEHTISGRESYLRIRCQRLDGKIAWSQPLFPQP